MGRVEEEKQPLPKGLNLTVREAIDRGWSEDPSRQHWKGVSMFRSLLLQPHQVDDHARLLSLRAWTSST